MTLSALLFSAALANAVQDNHDIERTQTEIAAACGRAVSVSVAWEAFGKDADGRQKFEKQGLGFLRAAMTRVCADAKLKTAFKAQVRGIVVSQAYGAADPMIYLDNGKMHVEFLWAKGEGGPDVAYVISEISSRLRGEPMPVP